MASVSRDLNQEDAQEVIKCLAESLLSNKVENVLPELAVDCICKGLVGMSISEEPFISPFVFSVRAVFCNLIPQQLSDECLNIVYKLLESIHRVESSVLTSICQTMASLVNKLEEEEKRTSLIEAVLKSIDESTSAGGDVQKQVVGVTLLSWLNRALAMMCHPLQQQTVDRLLQVLRTKEKDVAFNGAKGFLVTHQPEEYLSHETHAKIMAFYPQKFFLETIPSLLMGVNGRDSETWRRQAFRYAILGQLRFLPDAVVKSQVNRIHGVISTALNDTDCPENQGMAVTCIKHLLTNGNTASLGVNINSTISRLLALLVASTSRMQVKIDALKCLTAISLAFPERLLLPMRNQVVSGLKISLDDRKRLVRYAASEARLKWVLLGQPGA
jgi:hypothetical protein